MRRHRGTSGGRAALVIGMLAVVIAVAMSQADGQCQYDITAVISGPFCGEFLGWSSVHGRGLNDQGHIAGNWNCPLGAPRPFLWTPETGLVTLQPPEGWSDVTVEDMNNDGVITGWAYTPESPSQRAFTYHEGEWTIISPPEGDNHIVAFAINNHGDICGTYRGLDNAWHGFVRLDGVMHDVPPVGGTHLRCRDISDSGAVTGYMNVPNQNTTAILWEAGWTTTLGPVPAGLTSWGEAVNSQIAIAGWGGVSGLQPGEAFQWDSGQFLSLGMLDGYEGSSALNISESGFVVGNCDAHDDVDPQNTAVIWINGQIHDLNDFVDAGDVYLSVARAINEQGQIMAAIIGPDVGNATVLLTPISVLGDLTGDCTVNAADLAILLGSWGEGPDTADLNSDSRVNAADLAILLGSWSSE